METGYISYEPYGFSSRYGKLLSILFFVIQVQLFFLFGRSLEQAWGTFRFNMYFLSGYLFNIIAALILYLSPLHSQIYYSGFQYIYWSMFFAFAALNPDMQFLLYFIIPIKVKWLAILDAAYMLYQVVQSFYYGIMLYSQGASGSLVQHIYQWELPLLWLWRIPYILFLNEKLQESFSEGYTQTKGFQKADTDFKFRAETQMCGLWKNGTG